MKPEDETETWCNRCTKISKTAKIYLVVVLCHAITLYSLGVTALINNAIESQYAWMSFFVTTCFTAFSIQGINRENYFQIRASIVSALLITLFVVWYMSQSLHTITLCIGCISIVACLIYIAMYKPLVKRFGWYVYDKLNMTSEALYDLYLVFQIVRSMIHMDTQICLLFVILVLAELSHSSLGYLGNALCVLLQIVWAIATEIAVRNEYKKWIQFFVAPVSILVIPYVITYVVWSITNKKWSEKATPFQFEAMAVIVICCRIVTLFWIYRAYQNFNKGIKQYVRNEAASMLITGKQSDKETSLLDDENPAEVGNTTALTGLGNDDLNTDHIPRLQSNEFE